MISSISDRKLLRISIFTVTSCLSLFIIKLSFNPNVTNSISTPRQREENKFTTDYFSNTNPRTIFILGKSEYKNSLLTVDNIQKWYDIHKSIDKIEYYHKDLNRTFTRKYLCDRPLGPNILESILREGQFVDGSKMYGLPCNRFTLLDCFNEGSYDYYDKAVVTNSEFIFFPYIDQNTLNRQYSYLPFNLLGIPNNFFNSTRMSITNSLRITSCFNWAGLKYPIGMLLGDIIFNQSTSSSSVLSASSTMTGIDLMSSYKLAKELYFQECSSKYCITNSLGSCLLGALQFPIGSQVQQLAITTCIISGSNRWNECKASCVKNYTREMREYWEDQSRNILTSWENKLSSEVLESSTETLRVHTLDSSPPDIRTYLLLCFGLLIPLIPLPLSSKRLKYKNILISVFCIFTIGASAVGITSWITNDTNYVNVISFTIYLIYISVIYLVSTKNIQHLLLCILCSMNISIITASVSSYQYMITISIMSIIFHAMFFIFIFCFSQTLETTDEDNRKIQIENLTVKIILFAANIGLFFVIHTISNEKVSTNFPLTAISPIGSNSYEFFNTVADEYNSFPHSLVIKDVDYPNKLYDIMLLQKRLATEVASIDKSYGLSLGWVQSYWVWANQNNNSTSGDCSPIFGVSCVNLIDPQLKCWPGLILSNPNQITCLPNPSKFYSGLNIFLSGANANHIYSMNISDGKIQASKVGFMTQGLSTSSDFSNFITQVRSITEESNLDAFVTGWSMSVYDININILSEIKLIIGCSSVVLIVIISFFMYKVSNQSIVKIILSVLIISKTVSEAYFSIYYFIPMNLITFGSTLFYLYTLICSILYVSYYGLDADILFRIFLYVVSSLLIVFTDINLISQFIGIHNIIGFIILGWNLISLVPMINKVFDWIDECSNQVIPIKINPPLELV